jgi:hypothetical protein
VLWPFVAVVRPPFSGAAAFPAALGGALLVLAATATWLLMSDAMFDEVAGKGGGTTVRLAPGRVIAAPARATSVGWTLPLTGRPELALFWKGAMETFRALNIRSWRVIFPIMGLLFGVFGATMGIAGAQRLQGTSAILMVLGCIIAAVSVLLGPQVLRSDLRGDFEHLDLLKTWPLRAAAVIRGEMAWPALMVSAIAWLGAVMAAMFSGTALPALSVVSRWSFALAAAIAGPALVCAQYAVHATFTILFPAWVQLGTQRQRGIDAMGQRLIMLLAIVLSLAAFALPGALGGGVVWLIFRNLVGNFVFVPAAVIFATIVLVEVLAVTELLGPAYERIDVTSVERAE